MASRIEGKRETSPISSAQVSAVMGPTPGTVLSRLIRSASKGSPLEGTDQGVFRFQPDTFIHLFVAGEQLTEIAHFVQPPLVVAMPWYSRHHSPSRRARGRVCQRTHGTCTRSCRIRGIMLRG